MNDIKRPEIGYVRGNVITEEGKSATENKFGVKIWAPVKKRNTEYNFIGFQGD